MTYDFLVMAAVHAELQERAAGARVQRIYQLNRYEVVLYMHRQGGQFGLILSCHPRWARVHLTWQRRSHPDRPAPFCMLLRKYLVGGSISRLRQQPMERVLEVDFNPPEGMPPVKLVAEIMGRRSNLLLLDGDGVILGAVKTASSAQNPKRPIQAGEQYRPVPPQQKLDPLSLPPGELAAVMEPLVRQGGDPEQALVQTVLGVSPLAARELVHRSGWSQAAPEESARRLCLELQNLFTAAREGRCRAVLDRDREIFAPYRLTHLPAGEQLTFRSINELLDHLYGRLIEREETERLREQLGSRVERQQSRLENKLREQEKELQASGDASLYRLYGELLLAHAAKVPRGCGQAELPDLYNPGQSVTVPLDPGLAASANAQKYFARYRKAQKGNRLIREQLTRTRTELDYCRGLLYTIQNGDRPSLEEIRNELVEAGYLKLQQKARRKQEAAPQPLFLRSSSGSAILVGRNNRQNDYVTFKAASRRDTWLHARELPGSHVVIRGASFPPAADDLEEAALLAAHFSRGRDSSAVAVDYTQLRHVRRGPGGKPGFVLYDNFQTITVNPLDERLAKLLEQQPDNG